jgi:2-keto-3-deoxy-L-rhamnonate aldolase RhmA
VSEIQALEGYIRAGAADTQQVLVDGEQRIKSLDEQVRQLRAVMEQRVQEQQAAVRACNDRKLGIQQVLEFFGQEAVARVVQASPKLQAPSR